MNRSIQIVLALGLLAGCFSLFDVRAAATEIASSSPQDGSQLDSVPDVVEIWSTEPLDSAMTQIIAVAPNGARIDTGVLESDPGDATHFVVNLVPFGQAGHFVIHLLSGEPNTARERSDSISFDVAHSGECKEGDETSPCATTLPEVAPGEVGPLPDGGNVTVQLSSERAGPVDITVSLAGPNGESYDEARVWVRAAHLEMDHGEFPHEAVVNETGVWSANYVGMGMEGQWRIAVDIIISPGAVPVTIFVPVEMQLPG